MKKKSLSLTTQILIALIAGFVAGLILNMLNGDGGDGSGFISKYVVGGVFKIGGTLFINAIKLLVVPLVFISIVGGVAAIGDLKKLGRVGGKTLLFYVTTTAIAITIAILIGTIVRPGVGLDLSSQATDFTVDKAPSLADTLINIVPSNPFRSMVEGHMLQVIFFAILVGMAIAALGKRVATINAAVEESNLVVNKMVALVMYAAPIGVFCLIAKVFAEQGFTAFMPLLKYMVTLVAALLIHLVLVYCGALKFIGRLSPIAFFKKFYPVMLMAFSTASSAATLPLTMKTAEKRLGVSRNITSFTLPFGATVNMDGTAIMQGVAVVFIAQVYGVDLTVTALLTVILMATLASIGTAAVPSAGMITLSMVLAQVQLPVEGIALVLGVDRIMDMSRTAVNVSGDTVVTLIVAKGEGEFDQKKFNDPDVRIDDEG